MFEKLNASLLIKILSGLCILTSIALLQIRVGFAQSDADGWSTPINISNSGSTTNPQLVIDSNGIFHAIWIDEFAGYVYTQSSDSKQWSTPTPLSFPFLVDDSLPLLLADPRGYVHAFWMNLENTLFYSRVIGNEFGNPASWQSPIILAESALDLDAIVDSSGNLHFSYVRPLSSEQFPAGIYYRKSSDSGQSWSDAALLYQSNYFRSLTPEDAHVQISSTNVDGEEHIYVAWDNRPIKRILLIKSLDTGESWDSVTEIDGPSASTVTIAPFNVIVQPEKDNVLVVWQSGLQSGFDCNQYFKWSDDQGNSWSERQLMLEDLVGCPEQNIFKLTSDGTTILWTIIQEQVYLLAWKGAEWSKFQTQPDLNLFTNPETFEGVNFRCRQPVLTQEDQLFVVGCDTVGTTDIWITSYTLDSYSNWFSSAESWSVIETVTSATEINNPQIVYDNAGKLYAFWSQSPDSSNNSEYSIYLAQYENDSWSQAVNILSSPTKHSDKPSVIYDPSSDRLMVVWEDRLSGEIYFSWADASKAINPLEWSVLTSLPISYSNASSPDISVDNLGNIYVAYAVPLNEGRGIYITKSTDGGITWGEAFTVFDAALAKWEMVDEPHLTLTDDGDLYIIWKRYPLLNETLASGLYSSKSEDNGLSWSLPETITDRQTSHADVLGLGALEIHRFWQSENNDVINLWHQVSNDSGKNWSTPENLSRFGETSESFDITADQSGKIYLVETAKDINENLILNLLIWDIDTWNYEEGLQIGKFKEEEVESVTTDFSLTGKLAIVFDELSHGPDNDSVEYLNYSERLVQLPVVIISTPDTGSQEGTIEANPTQIIVLTQEPPSTLTPNATSNVDQTTLIETTENVPSRRSINNSLGLIIGGSLSILLVGIVFLIGIIKIKRGN